MGIRQEFLGSLLWKYLEKTINKTIERLTPEEFLNIIREIIEADQVCWGKVFSNGKNILIELKEKLNGLEQVSIDRLGYYHIVQGDSIFNKIGIARYLVSHDLGTFYEDILDNVPMSKRNNYCLLIFWHNKYNGNEIEEFETYTKELIFIISELAKPIINKNPYILQFWMDNKVSGSREMLKKGAADVFPLLEGAKRWEALYDYLDTTLSLSVIPPRHKPHKRPEDNDEIIKELADIMEKYGSEDCDQTVVSNLLRLKEWAEYWTELFKDENGNKMKYLQEIINKEINLSVLDAIKDYAQIMRGVSVAHTR